MSYQIKLDPKSRKAARFISQLQKKIQKAFMSTGKTQQEVADILQVDRSVVNRRLTGTANLTARSIAELAYALEKDIYVELVDRHQVVRSNLPRTSDQIFPLEKSPASGTFRSNDRVIIEKTAA